jgi:hypothetical protein
MFATRGGREYKIYGQRLGSDHIDVLLYGGAKLLRN